MTNTNNDFNFNQYTYTALQYVLGMYYTVVGHPVINKTFLCHAIESDSKKSKLASRSTVVSIKSEKKVQIDGNRVTAVCHKLTLNFFSEEKKMKER